MEWCSEVLFARSRVNVMTKEEGPNKILRGVAIGGKDRYLVTSETAGAIAKNRMNGMPDEIPLDFAEFAKYLRTPPAGNIAGEVVDGSSKKAG